MVGNGIPIFVLLIALVIFCVLTALIAIRVTRTFGVLLLVGLLFAVSIAVTKSIDSRQSDTFLQESRPVPASVAVELQPLAEIEKDIIEFAESDRDSDSDTDEIDSSANSAKELSSSPPWTQKTMWRVGNVTFHTLVAGPFSTSEECHESMDSKLLDAVAKYVEKEFLVDQADSFVLASMGVTPKYVRKQIVEEWYDLEREHDFGAVENSTMQTVYARLRFDSSVHDDLYNRLRRHQQQGNLHRFALAGAGILGLLILALLGLQFDSWCRSSGNCRWTKQARH